MEKINLKPIFNKVSKEKYLICKIKETFPDYEFGSDLDILVIDPSSFVKALMSELNNYVGKETYISINEVSETQTQIDLVSIEGNINIRFDIYSGIPKYSKLNINRTLFDLMISNRESKKINGIEVYVPSLIDECLIRFFEYIEYYEIRPDKLKHMHFIMNQLENEDDKEEFFSRLHLYTKLNLLPVPENTHFSKKIIEDADGIISSLNEEIEQTKRSVERLEVLIENYLKDFKHSDETIVEIDKRIDRLEGGINNLFNSDIFRFGAAVMNPLRLPGKLKRLIKRKIKGNENR